MAKRATLIAVLAMLIAGSIAGVFGREVAHKIGRALWGESAGDVLRRPWTSQTVAGLTISSPRPFVPTTLDLPPDAERALTTSLERLDAFRAEAGPVEVTVAMMLFKPGATGSLQGAVDGSTRRLSHAPGVSNFQHVNTPLDLRGYPAVRTSASFTGDGRDMRMESLVFMTPRALWQVQTLFPASDPASQIADRLLSSVAF